MKLLLVIPSFFLTLLLVVHAVNTKGARTARWFFVSAFLFGVLRGNSVAVLAGGADQNPYVFSDAVLRLGRAELAACVGWVFAVYLSWVLAEAVVQKSSILKDKLLPLVSFALVAMACFSYAVETTASGVGWWRWNIVRRANPFLVGGTHLFGIVEWMSVIFDFLLPFLLFRTSRGARYWPAWASLLLYPLHWATHWRQNTLEGFPHAYEIYHALVAISVLVFPLLRFPSLKPLPAERPRGWIEQIPFWAVLGMFSVLALADLAILKEPELLISLLPLGLFLAATRWRQNLGVLTLAAAMAVLVATLFASGPGWPLMTRIVPILLPLASLALFCESSFLRRRNGRRSYVFLIFLTCLATGVGLTWSKRERDRYGQLVDEGWRLIQAGDQDRGESLLREAETTKPNINLAPKLLARLYGRQGRLDEAWDAVDRSLHLDPTDWESYQLGGNVLRSQQRCDEAVPLYQRGLLLHPGDEESAKGLAECLLSAQRYADALQVLRRSLKRNPEQMEIVYLLGGVLLQTQNYREAHRVVNQALARAPEDPGLHLLLAYVLAETGNRTGAIRECQRVLELDPTDGQARQLLESLQ